MKKKYNLYIRSLMVLIFFVGLVSCVEEFDFQTDEIQSLLVIDATITNELKNQEVFLSRTYEFQSDTITIESGASVFLQQGDIQFVFSEVTPGRYVSDMPFQAEPNSAYRLEIETKTGSRYQSAVEELTPVTNIDSLYAVREVNGSLGDGISLFVDSSDPTGNARFYRYAFEETYKIIAPFWRTREAVVVSDVFPDCEVALVERPEDGLVCYGTDPSNIISVASTETTTAADIQRHRIHFLSNQNAKISHRYSLLAIQYVQTEAAYNYYNALLQFNDSQSLFSQIQTGYLAGNYTSVADEEENVIGFFQVASVSKKRIFFNYDDFYPSSEPPPYFTDCFLSSPPLFGPQNSMRCGSLINLLQQNAITYLRDNNGEFPEGGPYVMMPISCGDCRVLGETEIPEFWIE